MPIPHLFSRWLFHPAREEESPILLTQHRIFIIPGGTGLLYCLVLTVMLLAAINYNLSLGHALVFLLAGLGIVTLLHTYRNLIKLRLSPGRAQPVFAGQTAYFPLHVENPLDQARRALNFSFADGTPITLDLAARGQTTANIPCQASLRGLLKPGRVTLSTRYPLGFFYAWSHPHPGFSCLVYPGPLTRPLPPATAESFIGDQQGNAGQDDFAGLQPWQPSDPLHHIAWKAVERDFDNRPLLVKQFAGGAAEELWLDLTLTPQEADTETQLSILTGWVLAAEERQSRYGLRLGGRRLAPAQGMAHRDACLEALALYEKPPAQPAGAA